MKRILVPLVCLFVMIACKKPSGGSSGPQDTSIPTLSYPLASYSSLVRFIPFGAPVPGDGPNMGYLLLLTDSNQNFIAACPGIVQSIGTAGDGTPLINVQYKTNSIYSFTYSGFRSVSVQVNDSIAGGTILGRVGAGFMFFQMVKNGNQALCPQNYASPGFNSSIQFAIGQNNAYNPSNQVANACSIDSLPK